MPPRGSGASPETPMPPPGYRCVGPPRRAIAASPPPPPPPPPDTSRFSPFLSSLSALPCSNEISSPIAAPSKKDADLAEAVARAKRTSATAGLREAEVRALTLEFGKNELPEKKKSKILQVRDPHPAAHELALGEHADA
jgi:hypothetical protein